MENCTLTIICINYLLAVQLKTSHHSVSKATITCKKFGARKNILGAQNDLLGIMSCMVFVAHIALLQFFSCNSSSKHARFSTNSQWLPTF